MYQVASVPLTVVLIAGVIAGSIDAWKYRIFNVMTLPLLVSGLIYHAICGGWYGFGLSVTGAAVGLAIAGVPFCLGGMGGGDVKLLAGIGAWLGLTPTYFYVLIASALVAGVYSLALVMLHGELRRTLVNLKIVLYQIRAIASHLGRDESCETAIATNDRGQRVIPFAVMVAVGIIAVVVWGWVS